MVTETPARPVIGFIGLGDQGLPMAAAIAGSGYELHVWARRPSSLQGMGDTRYTAHDTPSDLAQACDIVAFCVGTDDDVLGLLTGGLLEGLRPGAVVVNHGTGTPGNAIRMARMGAAAGVEVLDAPVSGGRPGAETRTLTTMVGGKESVAQRCRPVFDCFSEHVFTMGEAGSGQSAKLFNNALMIMNEAAIADVVELATQFGIDPARLIEVLRVGSAASRALDLLNTMIRVDNVEHLSEVVALDMDIFQTAMEEHGIDADAVITRGRVGAHGLPNLVRRLNP